MACSAGNLQQRVSPLGHEDGIRCGAGNLLHVQEDILIMICPYDPYVYLQISYTQCICTFMVDFPAREMLDYRE